MSYHDRIKREAASVGLELDEDQAQRLQRYLELLLKWNKAYNLTAVRDPEQMIDRHLVDALTLLPFVSESESILDVGTGPGIPGMVLALVNPKQSWVLLDSNGKKTRFLKQVKMEMKVDNVEIIEGRVEDVPEQRKFTQITSRAFSSLQQMLLWCHHLLSEDGKFLAMKGQYPHDELAAIDSDQWHHQVQALPGPEGARHLVTLTRN